jgi:hypothetical protein
MRKSLNTSFFQFPSKDYVFIDLIRSFSCTNSCFKQLKKYTKNWYIQN